MSSKTLPLLKSRFRLVTFDCTNTLLTFRAPIGEEYANAAKLFSITANPEKLGVAFGAQWKVMTKKFPNYGKQSGLTSQTWWKNIIDSSFLNANCPLTSTQLNDLSDYLQKLYSTNTCWKLYPGSLQILELLQKHNVTVGVISNFDERLEPILQALGIRKYFSFVLASFLIDHEKPNREIFDLALTQANLNGLQCSEAVHIGDNYKLDYLAAKNAGWNAILFQTNPAENELTENVYVFSDFQDLTKYLFEPV